MRVLLIWNHPGFKFDRLARLRMRNKDFAALLLTGPAGELVGKMKPAQGNVLCMGPKTSASVDHDHLELEIHPWMPAPVDKKPASGSRGRRRFDAAWGRRRRRRRRCLRRANRLK